MFETRTARPALIGSWLMLCVSVTGSAQISVDLRQGESGTDEIVLSWIADLGVTGSFDILARTVPVGSAGPRPVDVLPLDPVGDLYLSDVNSPLSLSLASESDGEGIRIFSVQAADGACSNAAYIIRVFTDCWLHQPALPWRGGARTASALLELNPDIDIVQWQHGIEWGPRYLKRDGRGGLVGQDSFLHQGQSVSVKGTRLESGSVVTLGAAEPSPRGFLVLGGREDNVSADFLAPPIAASFTYTSELLCGQGWLGRDGDPPCDGGLFNFGAAGDSRVNLADLYRDCTFWDTSVRRTFLGVALSSGSYRAIDPARGLLFVQTYETVLDDRLFLPPDQGTPQACGCPDTDGDGTDDCSELLLGTDPADPLRFGSDHDRDGVPDAEDVCPAEPDPPQLDQDGDGQGDACDLCPLGLPACEDPDGDSRGLGVDLCPDLWDEPDQNDDNEGDLAGIACDNCLEAFNPLQRDTDLDGVGDACDSCPAVYNPDQALSPDVDADGVVCEDNCPAVPNPAQLDADEDGVGDACDCGSADADLGMEPGPIPDLRLSFVRVGQDRDDLRLNWTPPLDLPAGSVEQDLLIGSLELLWAGDPTGGAACLARDLRVGELETSAVSSRFFLVRARNTCGAGAWDSPLTDSPGADPCP